MPVPCLQRVDVGGGQPALVRAWRITRSWAGPLGAVRPLLAPSLVDGSAADHAEDPAAVAPGVGEPLQQEDAGAFGPGGPVRPRGEGLAAAVEARPRCRLNSTNRVGAASTVAPPARARPHSPLQRLRGEVDRDEEEEQAASTVIAGPPRAEGVGDAAGGDGDRAADRQIAPSIPSRDVLGRAA